jgi:hypothetical protein
LGGEESLANSTLQGSPAGPIRHESARGGYKNTMIKFRALIFAIACTALWAYADTAPPGAVKLKGADGTTIGNVGDAIKVAGQVTVSPSPLVVSISGVPTVAVSPSPQVVEIRGVPTVAISPSPQPVSATIVGVPQVQVSGTPTVHLDSPSVAVTNTPSVAISGVPQVQVSGVPHVVVEAIASPLPVIVQNPSVAVTNTPTVAISGVPHVVVDALASPVPVTVQNFPTPAPSSQVFASSLPLPSGAATESKQDAGNASLLDIDSVLSGAYKSDRKVLGVSFSGGTTEASGDFVFSANPAPGDTATITIGSPFAFTFISGASSYPNVHIGATVADTIDNWIAVLGSPFQNFIPSRIGSNDLNLIAQVGGPSDGANGNLAQLQTGSSAITLANVSADGHLEGGADALATQKTLQEIDDKLFLGQDSFSDGTFSLPVVTPLNFIQRVSGTVTAVISGTPSVAISPSPLPVTATISGIPTVAISPSPLPVTATISGIPTVVVSPSPHPVTISNVPTVVVSPSPFPVSATIVGTPTVVVSPSPHPVTISNVPTVVVSPSPFPVALADGADVALGAKADSAATDSTSSWSLIAIGKGLWSKLANTLTVNVNNVPTVVVSPSPIPVTATISGTPTVVVSPSPIPVTATISGVPQVAVSPSPLPVTATISGTATVSQSTSGGNPCLNPASTLTAIAGATSTTNATQIIAISGSTKIYLCAVNITGVSGTSPTFSLVYGTGSNCGSGQTTLLGAWTTTANTVYTFNQPFVTPAGQAVCYKDGGTSPVQNYAITYVQQ